MVKMLRWNGGALGSVPSSAIGFLCDVGEYRLTASCLKASCVERRKQTMVGMGEK